MTSVEFWTVWFPMVGNELLRFERKIVKEVMGKPSRYATGTTVSPEKSRVEVEQLLKRHGATGFMYGWDDTETCEQVLCRIEGIMLKFVVAQPDLEAYRYTETGRERDDKAAQKAADAEYRRRWRALLLLVKAKLEAIEAGLTSIRKEFLADILLPDNTTMGQWSHEQIDNVYKNGANLPPLLPQASGRT